MDNNDRPNVLIFITDQHRADYLSCYGHPILETPNIDSIAKRGKRFNRFYVANPVCMPNRATIMTGRMPSAHGVRSNGINLSLQTNTFVDLLRHQGYQTALIGKSHLQNIESLPPLFQPPEPAPDLAQPPAALREARMADTSVQQYGQEETAQWVADPRRGMQLPYYGFEQVQLCVGHGDQVVGDYEAWLSERMPYANELRKPENELPHDYICPQAVRTAIPEELYPTSFIAQKAQETLAEYAQHPDKPFLLTVSFPDPHHPFTPPGRYWDKYRPEDMVLPESFFNEDPSASVRHIWDKRVNGQANPNGHGALAVNEQELREAIALTCGMISMIDDAVGSVLSSLEANGFGKNTIIIFTSDHGDLMGDHRLILKGPLHFQSLIRVPFLWADCNEDVVPGIVDALAGSVDIARTVLERLGCAPYFGIQGQSLMPFINNQPGHERDAIVIESEDQRAYFDLPSPTRLRTLVTQRWRLTLVHGGPWGELYDLENDPHEIVNRWDDPEYRRIRGELCEQLAYQQMAVTDYTPLPTRQA